MKKLLPLIVLLFLLIYWLFLNQRPSHNFAIGQAIDSLHNVHVYYNGSVKNVAGRNVTADQYNLGLKYQCVEFVKRYYYQHYRHKMPDSYGHAKDFFEQGLPDGALNKRRNLYQYQNPSASQPKVGDLLVFSPTLRNRYGHVAIVSAVYQSSIEIIQQNPGKNVSSRLTYPLHQKSKRWQIKHDRIYGWLRK
jgi:surface antigen